MKKIIKKYHILWLLKYIINARKKDKESLYIGFPKIIFILKISLPVLKKYIQYNIGIINMKKLIK